MFTFGTSDAFARLTIVRLKGREFKMNGLFRGRLCVVVPRNEQPASFQLRVCIDSIATCDVVIYTRVYADRLLKHRRGCQKSL